MRKYITQNLHYLITLIVMFSLLTLVGTPMISYWVVVLLSGLLYMSAKKSVEFEATHRDLGRHGVDA